MFYLQYEYADSLTFDLVVTDSNGSGEYDFNEVVTLTADSFKDLVPFSHWEDGSGNILSYNQVYSFTMLSNRTVVAIYNASSTVVPVVSMTNDLNLRGGYDSYMGQFQLPAGYSVVEYGFVFSRSSDVLTLESLGATIVPSNVHQSQTKEFLRSFPVDTFNSIRAYLIVLNQSSIEEIYYSDNIFGAPTLSEQVIYQTGFESSEGFTAGTNYQSTISRGPEGSQWKFYFGTPSTDAAILGTQSAQMRYYTTNGNENNFGYIYTEFSFENVTKVEFSVTRTSTLNIAASYSIDNGENWIGYELFTLSSGTNNLTYNVNSNVQTLIKFELVISGSPSSGSKLIVDTVKVYGMTSTALHEVKYNVDGNESIELIADGLVVDKVVSKTGHTFNGWYFDSELTNQYISTPVNESLILYAKFTVNSYQVFFNYNGADGGDRPASIQGNYQSQVSLPEPTKTGYDFIGWESSTGLTQYSSPYTIPANNTNMYAKWEINDLGRTLEDAAEISLPSQISVATTLTLPILGSKGSTIAWLSSHESIINSTNGNVILPVEDTTVTLTASVTYNDEETIRNIQINVIAEDSEPTEPIVLRQSDFGETNSNNSTYGNFYIDDVENGSLDSLPNGKSPYSRAGGNYNGTGWDYLAFGQNNVAARLGDMVTSNFTSNVAVDASDPNNYVATRFTLNGVIKVEIRLFLLKLQTTIYLQSSIDGINWISVSMHEQVTAISSDTTITFDNLSGSGDLYYRIVFVNASPGSNGWLGRLKSLTFYGNP